MKNTLTLKLLTIIGILLTVPTKAESRPSVLIDMSQAREFAEMVHEIRRKKLFMGDFRREEAHATDIIAAYDAELLGLLGDDFQVEIVDAKPSQIDVLVKNKTTGNDYWLSSRIARYNTAPAAVSSVKNSIKESLSFSIEQSKSMTMRDRGSFVSVTEKDKSVNVSAGREFENFTFTVFGNLTDENWNIGANVQAKFDLGSGVSLGLKAQVDSSVRQLLNFTEGSFSSRADRSISTSLRVQISKTWSRVGITATAGVQSRLVGLSDFDGNLSAYAFVSLGKEFLDANNQPIASLSFLAMRELGMGSQHWMLGLMASFKF